KRSSGEVTGTGGVFLGTELQPSCDSQTLGGSVVAYAKGPVCRVYLLSGQPCAAINRGLACGNPGGQQDVQAKNHRQEPGRTNNRQPQVTGGRRGAMCSPLKFQAQWRAVCTARSAGASLSTTLPWITFTNQMGTVSDMAYVLWATQRWMA